MSKNRVIDSPNKTLEGLKSLRELTKYLQRCSRNKDYNAGEHFARVLNRIYQVEEMVENSVDDWEEIMSEGDVIADYEW